MNKRYDSPTQPGIWLQVSSTNLAVAGAHEQMIA